MLVIRYLYLNKNLYLFGNSDAEARDQGVVEQLGEGYVQQLLQILFRHVMTCVRTSKKILVVVYRHNVLL